MNPLTVEELITRLKQLPKDAIIGRYHYNRCLDEYSFHAYTEIVADQETFTHGKTYHHQDVVAFK